MKAPFPHFGAKHRVAPIIWERFGNPSYFYEPFGGSLGTLLARPEVTGPNERQRYEYACDADCLITNFWRAAKFANAEDMARLAEWPTSQLDLEARSAWLQTHRQRLLQSLKRHPKWYDLECAAYFVWVQSVKISTNGTSVVLRRTAGVRRRNQDLASYFTALAERLKNVTIHFGDWTKLANAASRESLHSDVAILLDPPYKYATGRQKGLYVTDSGDVAEYVHRWALAISQTRPKLKIALCGFVGEHKMPPEWEEVAWQSKLGKGRERIWFSPSCQQLPAPKAEAVHSRDTIQPLPVVIRSEDDGVPLGFRPVSVLARY